MISVSELPPLTGSALFDPWRIRYREQLLTGSAPGAARRPTKSEVLLWEELRRSGRGWVAEFPTRYGYRLDFYCEDVRLAVEVDGPSHWGELKRERDAWRDTVHERMGIRTRRFSAAEVEADAGWVAAEIEAFAAQRAVLLAGGDVESGAGAVEVDQVEDCADELAEDPRRLAFPPEPPGWSAFLPACRTVLPEAVVRRSLVERLGSLTR